MRTVRVEAPPAPEGEAAPGTEVPSDAVVASSDALAAALSAAFAVEGAVVVVGDDKAAGEAAPAAAAPAPAAAAAVATTPAKKAWGAPAAGECDRSHFRVWCACVALCPLLCSESDVCGCVDSVFRVNERAPKTCAQLHVADCSVCLAFPPCSPPAVVSAGGASFAEVLRKNAGTAAPSTPGTATPAAASTTSAGAAADASGTEEAHAESTHAPSSGYKPRGGRRGG